MTANILTPEQQARDMLERMGWEKAQGPSAGDVVELANLISDVGYVTSADRLKELATRFCVEEHPDAVEIAAFVVWAYKVEGVEKAFGEILDEIEAQEIKQPTEEEVGRIMGGGIVVKVYP